VRCEREIVRTPRGELTSLFLPDRTCGVRLQKEYWIKDEADYEPMLFMVNDAVLAPDYDRGRALLDGLGEDGVVYVWKDYSPLQKILVHLTGVEGFCLELMDRPQHLMALYDALLDLEHRKTPIVVEAPGDVVQFCANPIASVLGRALFAERIIGPLNEFAEAAHQHGRLVSMHVDGDNAIWAEDIANSALDVVEAFTPAPDTDMTIAAGREAFKDKVLWVNFPSSVHLAEPDMIRATTNEILDAVAPGDRFVLGITEDIPPHCWRKSLSAILDVLEERGRLPLR